MRQRRRQLKDDERGYIAKLLRRCTAHQLAAHTGLAYSTIANGKTEGMTEATITTLMNLKVEDLPQKQPQKKGRARWSRVTFGADKNAPLYGPGWDS
jgi:hypothetical protein